MGLCLIKAFTCMAAACTAMTKYDDNEVHFQQVQKSYRIVKYQCITPSKI